MGVSAASLKHVVDERAERREALYHHAITLCGEGFLSQAIRRLREALAAVDSTASRAEELELKATYGRLLFVSGRTSQAFSFLSEALKISIEDNDPQAMSRVLVELGEVYETWGDPMLALEYLSKSHWILQNSAEFERTLRCIFVLLRIHFWMASGEECASYLNKAREQAERAKDSLLERLVRLQEAEVRLQLGGADSVGPLANEEIPKGSGELVRQCRIRLLKCLGLKELYGGRPASAGTYLREMLRELKRIKHRHALAEGLLLLARASRDLGDAAKAEWFLADAIKLSKRIENRRLQIEGQLMQLQERKADDRTVASLRKGLEQARQLRHAELILRYSYQLAAAHASLGHLEEAMRHCAECSRQVRRLGALAAGLSCCIEDRRDLRAIVAHVARLSGGAN